MYNQCQFLRLHSLEVLDRGRDGLTSSRIRSVSFGTLLTSSLSPSQVGWPLSIVLSKRVIRKYQVLSRLLFFSKYVELRVLATWQVTLTRTIVFFQPQRASHVHFSFQDDQGTKGLGVRGHMGASYFLRHRMLHFLQVCHDSGQGQRVCRNRHFVVVIRLLRIIWSNHVTAYSTSSQNFVYYMTLEVIGPRGHEMQEKSNLAQVMNVVQPEQIDWYYW